MIDPRWSWQGGSYEKNRTICMRPEIVPEGLLTKGYSWEVKFAESKLNPSCHIPQLKYSNSCVYNVCQRKDCSLQLVAE